MQNITHNARMWLLIAILVFLATVSTHAADVEVPDYRAFCACIILTSLNQSTNAFSAQLLLGNISGTLSTSELEMCNNWTAYPDYEISTFADKFGKPTSNISESAGAFAPDIYAFCGPPKFVDVCIHDYVKLIPDVLLDFTSSTVGLLLPWIAIFAQLPRQTGRNYDDLLSIFVSIGSPAWISSSVLLAVLFRRAVGTRFDRIRAKLGSGPSGSIFLHLAKRCEAAKIIAQAFIQAPVRLNPRPGFLSSLIIFPENHWWWMDTAAEIKGLWRRIDAVFVVQTIIAGFAWLLAIIADFWSLPGAASSNSSEWQICMGTLWLWVFEATFGSVAIKSHFKAKAMNKALCSHSEPHNKLSFALSDGDIVKQHGQTAIEQRSGLVPQWLLNRRPSVQEYEINDENEKAYDSVRIPKLWGFSIEGDGASEGLIGFPPRFFPSEQASDQIIRGFESLLDRLKKNQIPDADQEESPADQEESAIFQNGLELTEVGIMRPLRTWNSMETPERNLRGSAGAIDRYLGIDFGRFTAYPEWKDISPGQLTRFIMANIFGLVIQWGTSGLAIYVMYYSPPIGLGCDSGGLLIYAVGATLSWFLLTMSSLLSHAALLHYQRHHREYPYQPILGHYRRTRFHTFLCAAAVITRVLGKFIAVISACWILVWSFFTYSNVMETPYCTTAYFSLRQNGWMRLWDFDPKQFTTTKVEELRCLVLGSFLAYFACVLIFHLTSDRESRKARWIITTTLSLGFPSFVIPLYICGVTSIEEAS